MDMCGAGGATVCLLSVCLFVCVYICMHAHTKTTINKKGVC